MKNKFNFKGVVKRDIFLSWIKLGALFVLGFLIGIMLKSQAMKNVVTGYDDQSAMTSDKIQLNIDN